jgi:hypothetical protein
MTGHLDTLVPERQRVPALVGRRTAKPATPVAHVFARVAHADFPF